MNVLTRPTLVLNKNWVPINTVPVKEAVKMCCGDWLDIHKNVQPKAKILDIDTWQLYSWDDWKDLTPSKDDVVIHSAHGVHKAPEIIIASRFNKIPKNQLNFNKKNVLRRDGDQCQYCGKNFPPHKLSFDHVTPRCQGGLSDWENIVVSCFDCNQKKGGRTPEQAGMKLLRQPVKPGIEVIGSNQHRIKSWEIFFGRAAPGKDESTESYWQMPYEQ